MTPDSRELVADRPNVVEMRSERCETIDEWISLDDNVTLLAATGNDFNWMEWNMNPLRFLEIEMSVPIVDATINDPHCHQTETTILSRTMTESEKNSVSVWIAARLKHENENSSMGASETHDAVSYSIWKTFERGWHSNDDPFAIGTSFGWGFVAGVCCSKFDNRAIVRRAGRDGSRNERTFWVELNGSLCAKNGPCQTIRWTIANRCTSVCVCLCVRKRLGCCLQNTLRQRSIRKKEKRLTFSFSFSALRCEASIVFVVEFFLLFFFVLLENWHF